ncbi:MAG: hypothetical protein LC677_06505, partial [Halomonas sp.]|nr:hypothetical protein [Halomonas sp.]
FISLALLLCSATTAFSQDTVSAEDVLDIEEIERIADIARAGSDPRITASLADQSGRDENRTNPTPPVLVSIQGDPAFVYTRGANYDVPEGEPEFVMRCRGDGMIELTTIVSQLMDDPLELSPDDEDLLHIRPYGQDREFTMPVALGESFPSHRKIVRVTGSARADSSFFTDLQGTTNFSYQLKRNGAFLPMTGGLDFSTFREDVGPLLAHCRAGKPNPRERTDPDEIVVAENARPEQPAESDMPKTTGRFTPNPQDIQNAIQARVDVAFQRLDAMGDQCNTYRRDNNPVAAMMCLFSGGGAMNSSTGNMHITSVSLDHCVQMEDPDVSAYCRYRADMAMTGSGMMGQVASLVNAASAFNQWTWASFRRDGQTWQLVESWDNCRIDDRMLRCTSRR